MKASQRGVDLVASFEGLRLTAYKPVPTERHHTIGYGHYGPDVKPGQVISRTTALKLLREDLRWAELAVDRRVTVPLTQGQFDALVSFVFNVGEGAFASSTLLRRVNGRRWRLAANQFLRWNKGGGHVLLGLSRRRRKERSLFLKSSPKKRRTHAR